LSLTSPEDLEGKRYVTVIVRLLVDRRGKLVGGELANVDGPIIQSRFAGWSGLREKIEYYLEVSGQGAPK
jgi:hypothetical protein